MVTAAPLAYPLMSVPITVPFLECRITGLIHHVNEPFEPGPFHLAEFIRDSSVLLHIAVFCSFLWLSGIPVYGCTTVYPFSS